MGWMKLLPKEVTDDKMGKDRMMKEEVVENRQHMVMVMMKLMELMVLLLGMSKMKFGVFELRSGTVILI